MILIADSGGTKTDWVLIGDEGMKEFRSVGLNPSILSSVEINEQLDVDFSDSDKESVEKLFFYGAGCSTFSSQTTLLKCLSAHFKKAKIVIESDILGAARAIFGNKNGIVGVLGTGSGSGYFDKGKLVRTVSGMGFILGDEGSGAHIGKTLLSLYIRKKLPSHIDNLLFAQIGSSSTVISSLYSDKRQNEYLAQFAKLVHVNKEDVFIQDMLRNCFNSYVEILIKEYPYLKFSLIGLVGTVAFSFQEELNQVFSTYGIKRPFYLKSPIQGLIKYHQVNEKVY